MHLFLKVDHREIEIYTGHSLYLKSTLREVFLVRERNMIWWPTWEHDGKGNGTVDFLGWHLVYSVPQHQFVSIRR